MRIDEVGVRIREARLKAGFTNASQFARCIGVKPATLYRYETGRIELRSLDVALEIMNICDISLEWLIRGDGTHPSSITPVEDVEKGPVQ